MIPAERQCLASRDLDVPAALPDAYPSVPLRQTSSHDRLPAPFLAMSENAQVLGTTLLCECFSSIVTAIGQLTDQLSRGGSRIEYLSLSGIRVVKTCSMCQRTSSPGCACRLQPKASWSAADVLSGCRTHLAQSRYVQDLSLCDCISPWVGDAPGIDGLRWNAFFSEWTKTMKFQVAGSVARRLQRTETTTRERAKT